MKIKQVLLVLSIVIFCSVVSYRLGVLADITGSLKSIVEPGSMVTEASYVIFTDGNNYYARNGNTGEIEFESTNASAVFVNVMNYFIVHTKMGIVFVKAGYYVANIVIPRGVRLIGEHPRSVIINGTVSFNQTFPPSFLVKSSVENMWIWTKASMGVDVEGDVQGIIFKNVRVNAVDYDFYLNGTDMYGCIFQDITTEYGGTYGIYINGYIDDSEFSNVLLGPQDYGFYVSSNGLVAGTLFEKIQTGKPVKQAIVVHGYFIRNSIIHALWGDLDTATVQPVVEFDLQSSKYPTLVNNDNVFTSSGIHAGDAANGTMLINTGYVGTIFRDCCLTGNITIGTSAQNTQFINPQPFYTRYTTVQTATFTDHGTNTVFSGYGFENSGSWSGSSPVYVAHGLAGTPTVASISVNDTQPYATSWTANSTHITIYHNGAGSLSGSWEAKYQP
jgi:hypothetical protein